ncbi:hypothetical protein [Streptococcus cuniculipharyngis]|uniref:Uncharacterized protein n=1 Tax=Streptococcus cuniculipharyngis TaxID=1562651 RepID=A0A5C5SEC6_9STRE|nr:hypothetical protein [Streptococcus cuniculipharyngis]TWS99149.1 hypothetical protein FRX57_02825 [Streptococcus cuniculipharyngis]
MGKIDNQMIVLCKVEENSNIRRYSAVSGECTGVATVVKNDLNYQYEGDDLGKFTNFVKDTLIRSVQLDKQLPEKIVHGFG